MTTEPEGGRRERGRHAGEPSSASFWAGFGWLGVRVVMLVALLIGFAVAGGIGFLVAPLVGQPRAAGVGGGLAVFGALLIVAVVVLAVCYAVGNRWAARAEDLFNGRWPGEP